MSAHEWWGVACKLGVLAHFAPLGYFLVLAHFRLKKSQTRKAGKIQKGFEVYQVLMYNFCGKLS